MQEPGVSKLVSVQLGATAEQVKHQVA
jgi:hypothetical protein